MQNFAKQKALGGLAKAYITRLPRSNLSIASKNTANNGRNEWTD